MTADFAFDRQGRTWRTAAVVLVIWAVLLWAWWALEAAAWITGGLALFTLPACWDLWANPASGLRLDADQLRFFSGRRSAAIPLAQIDHVRLDTRLDFSVRATLMLRNGEKIRLPFEATPPHIAFEAALEAREIKVRRTHFQLFQ